MAPSCTDADSETASDTDTAVLLAAVRKGCDLKAILDREVIPPRPQDMFEEQNWFSMYGTAP